MRCVTEQQVDKKFTFAVSYSQKQVNKRSPLSGNKGEN